MSGAGGHIGQGALAPLAAGAWLVGEEDPGGPLWSQYCTITQSGPGQYDVNLEQACAPGNFAVGFSFIGPFANNFRYTCEEISDRVKRFKFLTTDGEDFINASFSFIMWKGPR